MKETVCTKCNKAYDAAFGFCPYCGQKNAPGGDDRFAEYEQYISTEALARASLSHDNGEYMDGYNRLPGFVISEMLSRQLREARLGSVVYMGRIMQDGFGPTPIGWRVIATTEDELLLLSERIILSAPPMWSGKWTDSILFSDIDYSFF